MKICGYINWQSNWPRIVCEWDYFAKTTVGSQVVKAADSIGANIADGTGRGSYQDNRRFVRIARGSLNETQHWLRRAYKRKLLNQEKVDLLKPIIEELAPKLNAYLKSIGPKENDGYTPFDPNSDDGE